MVLSSEDAKLFFRLMLPLQYFVNQKLGLVPGCSSVAAYEELNPEEKLTVRDALFNSPELIDDFVAVNPEGFTSDELKIVQGWRNVVPGEFFIERYLAKHAIFILEETVYAVLALRDPFDEIVWREQLPAYVKTVLLPFKGRIVYDGILAMHSMTFGHGISSRLRETYLTAKQNGRIITSLDPDELPVAKKQRPPKPAKDWTPTVDALQSAAQELSVASGTPPIQAAAFNLVKISLEMAHASVHEPGDMDRLWEQARKVDRACRKLYTTLNRAG